MGPARTYLWPCWAISMARRAGTGEPPSVTLSTSMDLRSGLRLPCRFSIGESTRFRGGSVHREGVRGGLWGWEGGGWATPWKAGTCFIPGGQVLILMARIPFLPVQEEEVDHLFLVLPGRTQSMSPRTAPGDARPARRARPAHTHSSESRSCNSLLRSRKQPSECMLSSTSGSMSSRLGSERICTLRGAGCSGSGSFLPPLWATGPVTTGQLGARASGPQSLLLSLRPAPQQLCPACTPPHGPQALRADLPSPPSRAGPLPWPQAKQVISGRKSYLHIPCVFLNVL